MHFYYILAFVTTKALLSHGDHWGGQTLLSHASLGKRLFCTWAKPYSFIMSHQLPLSPLISTAFLVT